MAQKAIVLSINIDGVNALIVFDEIAILFQIKWPKELDRSRIKLVIIILKNINLLK